jgi:hypothetical protein
MKRPGRIGNTAVQKGLALELSSINDRVGLEESHRWVCRRGKGGMVAVRG